MRDTERVPLDALTEIVQLKRELRDLRAVTLKRIHNVSRIWTDWSPTYVNLTVGNGIEVARYWQHANKTVALHYSLKFGSTTTIDGSGVTVSLPVNAHSSYILTHNIVGDSYMFDDDAPGTFHGVVNLETVSTMAPSMHWVVATYSQPRDLSATIPHTWAVNDVLYMSAFYEAV